MNPLTAIEERIEEHIKELDKIEEDKIFESVYKGGESFDFSGEVGMSLLGRHCGKGHRRIVLHLLNNGADPEVADENGMTAVDYANGEMKEFLRSWIAKSKLERIVEIPRQAGGRRL